MEYIDCTPDFPRRPSQEGMSMEKALAIGLIPTRNQQLLDQEAYGLTLPPITATIEGEV